MKTIKRLEELLDKKDAELDQLADELEKTRDYRERDWEWCRHRIIEGKQKLPVPRLEMRCEQDIPGEWHNITWQYFLVYKHTLGHIAAVPMGQTTSQGSRGQAPIYNGVIHTPFRDGVHICMDAEQLKLPAFAICDGKTWKLSLVDGKCHQEPLANP